MKFGTALAVAIGVAGLVVCNNSPTEQAADNVEQNAEDVADNFEEAADNAGSEAVEGGLENQADAARAAGENAATDMRTNDPDTNLANGL